jgi:hypothetical protein
VVATPPRGRPCVGRYCPGWPTATATGAVTVAQQLGALQLVSPLRISNQRAHPPNLGDGEAFIQMELLLPIYWEHFSGSMRVHKANLSSDYPLTLSARRAAELSYFSKRVTCRLARSHVERDAIFKLRYQSSLRAGLISQNSFGRYLERADHAANTYIIGLYVDRKLISSLRLQISSPLTPSFSSLELFPDVLEPLRIGRKTVVDLSCVATDGGFARQHSWLPYVVLRSWIIAAEHFHADYISAAVRPQHQLFFKRALDCELHAETQLLPHHLASVGLVTLNFANSAEHLYENLPFLRSTPSERRELFEPRTMPFEGAGLRPSAP